MAASASALLIDLNTDYVIEGHQTSNNQILDAVESYLSSVPSTAFELYKATPPSMESGLLMTSYNTTWEPPGYTDDAVISWTGPKYISSEAYLLIKDGKNYPQWRLYDLTALHWNGMETIEVRGIWPSNGDFSHLALYGASTAVPEPTSLLLLGFGLVGLAGARRMLKK